ncbi:glycosyl hydrolase family 95 catalytic domain-containing protein [Sunxiuqinia rutila]|uniref:glycosyl hydrolase family 95 catalytic domain-containing protein n=1 Tax=Sunxiuqinia rutila TaxID=1397841 RepID=UPI003D35B669
MKRRVLLFALGVLVLVACEQPQDFTEKLWYKQPAKEWFEALPIGNGRIGAMVNGGINREHLQLNEESLWAGCPEQPYPEDVQKHYKHFQKLNLEGKFEQAYGYASKYLVTSPTGFRSYEPFGDLYIGFDHSDGQNYRREIDLNTGVATVEYEVGGKRFRRETFVSMEHDVLVYHFKSLDGQKVNAEVAFNRKKDVRTKAVADGVVIQGQIFDDPDGYDDNIGGSGKGGYHMKFAGRAKIITDGAEIVRNDEACQIKEVSSFTILFGAATNYNLAGLNFDESIDASEKVAEDIEKAETFTYAELKEAHVKVHSELYKRVNLDLAKMVVDTIPTDKRLDALKAGGDDVYLQQLLFQYGRYMLITSSAGKANLPANLQGIWNKDMWAAWESDYHMNINLQMNYWPADVCNLPETVRPLSEYLTRLAVNGKETAREFIGSEGWMFHASSNVFGRTTPSASNAFYQISVGYSFPLAGAWMTQTLWRHYQFTRDEQYLRETVYPMLKGSARFIMDFLQEDENGVLVTAPSYSPENEYIDPETGKVLSNTVASSVDIQIIRDVLNSCLEAEQLLGESNLTAEIKSVLLKLPEINIGANGTIMEWIQDYEEAQPGHRHISHLYGLYPSTQINPSKPELFAAARKTIERRLSFGGGQTGWSRAWMVNFYARLLDGDESYKHINALLKEQMTNNLFDLHPPRIFQIDGNLGVTAGMAEMLLQSHEPGIIRLLPALPQQWQEGTVSGLRARGNYELGMTWSEGKITKVQVKAFRDGQVSLVYQSKEMPVDMKSGETKEVVFL